MKEEADGHHSHDTRLVVNVTGLGVTRGLGKDTSGRAMRCNLEVYIWFPDPSSLVFSSWPLLSSL